MNIATLLFGIIVIIFAWRGYQKGFIGSITRVLSWIVAYPAAIFFTKPFAKFLIQNTALDGVIVYFIAGGTIFLGVSFVVSMLLNGLSRLIPDNDFTTTGSKVGGVSVGVVVGGILGLIAVYVLSLVQKPAEVATLAATEEAFISETSLSAETQNTTQTKVPSVSELNQARDSFIEASAKKLIGAAAATAVDVALDDKTATQVTKAFVEDPQTMLTHVQAVSNNGQVKALMSDEQIQSMLNTGDVQGLMRDAQFQELMNDPHMKALMEQSDVSSESGSQAAAEKMVAAWNRVNLIKHDPRVIAIISDPEFQQQLNAPNKLPLMMNPKLNQLTEIIFSSETPAATGSNNYQIVEQEQFGEPQPGTYQEKQQKPAADSEEKPKSNIYRWTDENGQVHYSDKPIEEKGE